MTWMEMDEIRRTLTRATFYPESLTPAILQLCNEWEENRAIIEYLALESGIDGLGDAERDRHEYTIEVCDECGHDEPTVEDAVEGFRRMALEAVKKQA